MKCPRWLSRREASNCRGGCAGLPPAIASLTPAIFPGASSPAATRLSGFARRTADWLPSPEQRHAAPPSAPASAQCRQLLGGFRLVEFQRRPAQFVSAHRYLLPPHLCRPRRVLLVEQLAKQRLVAAGVQYLAVGHPAYIGGMFRQPLVSLIDLVGRGHRLCVAGAPVIAVDQGQLHPRRPARAKGLERNSLRLRVFFGLAGGNLLADSCVLDVLRGGVCFGGHASRAWREAGWAATAFGQGTGFPAAWSRNAPSSYNV